MCTVKDHLVQEHDIIYTGNINIMDKADGLVAVINCDVTVLQLHLSNNHLSSTYVSVPHSFDSSWLYLCVNEYDKTIIGKRASDLFINNIALNFDQDYISYQQMICSGVVTSSCDNEVCLNDISYQVTSSVISTFSDLILCYTLPFSIVYNDNAIVGAPDSKENTNTLGDLGNIQHIDNIVCKQENGPIQFDMLAIYSNKDFLSLSIVLDCSVNHYKDLACVDYDIFRPVGKDVNPVPILSNQQSFTNPMGPEVLQSEENSHNAVRSIAANNQAEDKQDNIQRSNVTTTDKDQLSAIQHHMSATNATNEQSDLKKKAIEKDVHLSLLSGENHNTCVSPSKLEQGVVKDGKLPMASGTDQTTTISSLPSELKFMSSTKPSCTIDDNPLGAHIVKGLPKETEVLPTVGPQLDALYNTKFNDEVQSSHEEVRQKGNARTTFYQHEVEQHGYNPIKKGETNHMKYPPMNGKLRVKVPEVKTDRSKAANEFKPKSLPKRSCIVCGDEQYPLVNNLISHPHMDHYFVKERTEIKPSHYLAKLVLRHQYLNKYVSIYELYILVVAYKLICRNKIHVYIMFQIIYVLWACIWFSK